jgi:hypothetical protein
MFPAHIRKRLGAPGSWFSPVWFLSLFTFTFVLLGSPQRSYGVDVTLSWGANSEEDVAGYRVFDRLQGEPYNYNDPAWEGTDTTCTIYNLDDDSTYYFVVRAFDTSENESADSNEVSYQGVSPEAVLESLAITGTVSVTEGATAGYTATASFSDESTQTVTESASWSEDSSYATINSTGVLSTSEVTSDQEVTITASYTDGSVTKTAQKVVTIVDIPESNLPPWQPVITSPYDGQMNCERQMHMMTEPFSDPDGDPHSQSRWQISSQDDFDSTILDVTSSEQLTQLTVPHLVLEADATYYVRVRFYDVYLEGSDWSDIIEFTTAGDVNDVNGNGVVDDQEVGDDVDLNGDGIADHDQPDLIKCAHAIDGSGIIGVCKVSDSIEAIEAIETIDPATISDKPVDFLFGLFSYRIRLNEAGTTATVRIYFSEDISDAGTFYKYDTIGGWQDYAQHTTFNDDGRSITLELMDGGYGDSDRTANGVIVDPGGLAEPASVALDASAEPASESSSGRGGCFIETATRDSGSHAEPFNLCISCQPIIRLIIAPLVHMNYVLLNAFGPTGTVAGLLLAGFILSCLLRMRGRLLSQGVKKNEPLRRHQAQA